MVKKRVDDDAKTGSGDGNVVKVCDVPEYQCLYGEIVGSQNGKYNVKFRGACPEKGDVTSALIPKKKITLHSKLPKDLQMREEMRRNLFKKADEFKDCQYLQTRVSSTLLYDKLVYQFLHFTNIPENDPRHEVFSKRAFVTLVESTYGGYFGLVMDDRISFSFAKNVAPFYKRTGGTIFSLFVNDLKVTSEAFVWLKEQFSKASLVRGDWNNASMLVFKAFAFSRQRIDSHKDEGDKDSLSDVVCVCFYVIKLLQGKINDIENHVLSHLIRHDLEHYGSTDDFNIKKILWCFGLMFLKAANVAIRKKPREDFNLITTGKYGKTMLHVINTANLLVHLRPDHPQSHWEAWKSSEKIHYLVHPLPKNTPDIMIGFKSLCKMIIRGKNTADAYGDPFYQYLFDVTYAFWLPSDVCDTIPCTLQDIKNIVKQAKKYRSEFISYTADTDYLDGEICEGRCLESVKRIQEKYNIPTNVIFEKISSCLYFDKMFIDNYFLPGGKYEKLLQSFFCGNCKKEVPKSMCCAGCGLVHYCSRSCQKSHWQEHKPHCIPANNNNNADQDNNTDAPKKRCVCCSKVLTKVLVCSRCKVAEYCSKECQTTHWVRLHKNSCRPTTIVINCQQVGTLI